MENLRYGGRRVRGFALGGIGVGDGADDGIAALQAAFAQYGAPWWRNKDQHVAVAALQAAGSAAVRDVGPAIDASSGGDNDVMKLTHSAWTKNDKLARLDASDAATQADVNAAQALVTDMIALYGQAKQLAASKPKPASSPAPKPTSGPAPKPTSGPVLRATALLPATPSTASLAPEASTVPWAWIAGGAAVVVVGGGIALAAARRRAA